MKQQWRIAPLIVILLVAISLFISACGDNGTASNSTPTATTASGSTPTATAAASPTSSAAGAPTGAYTCVSGAITADGSSALAPLAKAVATDYESKCSGANITVNTSSSGTGLSKVTAGNVQIGNSDIFADPTKYAGLVDHQVAIVVFAVVINSKVTGVTNLTTDQLKSIYSGQTTNWSQVGGNNLPIVVISRLAGSGTRATFDKYVLGGPETVSGASHLTIDTTGDVVKTLNQTDGAIGYVATNAVKANKLTAVSIDGSAPTDDLVKSNTYKFWNIEHMYTKGPASDLAAAYINYMGSDTSKAKASSLSFIAIADMSADAIAAKQPKS